MQNKFKPDNQEIDETQDKNQTSQTANYSNSKSFFISDIAQNPKQKNSSKTSLVIFEEDSESLNKQLALAEKENSRLSIDLELENMRQDQENLAKKFDLANSDFAGLNTLESLESLESLEKPTKTNPNKINSQKKVRFFALFTILLCLVLFNLTGIYVFTQRIQDVQTCQQQITPELTQEFGINPNYCKSINPDLLNQQDQEVSQDFHFFQIDLSKINNPKNNWAKRNLTQVQKKAAELDQRKILLFEKKQEYEKKLSAIQNLELTASEIKFPPQSSKDFVKTKIELYELHTEILTNRINKYTQEYNQDLEKLNKQTKLAKSLGLTDQILSSDFAPLSQANLTNYNPNQFTNINNNYTQIRNNLNQINQVIQEFQESRTNDNNSYGFYLPILMYHRLEDFYSLPSDQQSNLRLDLTTSPSAFIQQLDYIQARGYQTITTEELERALQDEDWEFFDGKKIMLTFDDGHPEHYTIAYPELKKRGMKGVFGIYTAYRAIPPDKLLEMHNNNMELISHSYSHCMLGPNIPDERSNPAGGIYQPCSNNNYGFSGYSLISEEEIRYELRESRKFLENITGQTMKYLIYPYGSYNQTVINILAEEGYTIALKVGGGPYIDYTRPFQIGRVNVSGLHPPLGGWFAQN